MPQLRLKRRPYEAGVLAAWTLRRRDALAFPKASEGFRRLLRRKARSRTKRTHRFFGEEYVASHTGHREIHYGSFKWLTNKRFAADRELSDPDQERFRRALKQYFGLKRVERLQRAVQKLAASCRKQLSGKAPTDPDLWLVDRRGHHRFIEVKLPGDSMAPHQLAGMAAIACVLNGPRRVTVEVIHLHDDDRRFKDFCRVLHAG